MSSLRPSDRAPNLLLGAGTTIAADVEIGANVVIHDGVTLEPGVQLDHGAVLGRPALRNRDSRTPEAGGGTTTLLEQGAIVSPYALVSVDVRMGPHSFLGDHAHLREGTRLGADVVVGAGCGIGRDVEIGERVRLQNTTIVGPKTRIEPDCFLGPGVQILTGRSMGRAPRREAPVLRRGCQVGAGAKIMPGVEIGEESVVGAGAVVLSDVPSGAVVRGIPAQIG